MQKKNAVRGSAPHMTKKEHRKAAAKYVKSDAYHWTRRVLGAFKQNKDVQERVLAGHFDRAFDGVGKK